MTKGYWENKMNHRKFFSWLYTFRECKSMEDWYDTTAEDVCKNGGAGLMKHYDHSLPSALQSVYPEHSWQFEKFKRRITRPLGFWTSVENRREFIINLHAQLGHKSMDDWYKVTVEDICKNGGGGLLNYYNRSPSATLQSVYPQHNWDLQKFKAVRKTKTPEISLKSYNANLGKLPPSSLRFY